MMPTGAIELGNPVHLFFWADNIALNEIAITTTIVRQIMLVIFQTIKILLFFNNYPPVQKIIAAFQSQFCKNQMAYCFTSIVAFPFATGTSATNL